MSITYHFISSKMNIPCGLSIPENKIHAASVSLPTLEDVINYEENKNNWRKCLQSGYPRFFKHSFEEQVENVFREKFNIPVTKRLCIVASEYSVKLISDYLQKTFVIYEFDTLFAIELSENETENKLIDSFIQHTGIKAFTRQLELFLFQHNKIKILQTEELISENSDLVIKKELSDLYESVKPDDIILCSCGMNAVHSVYEAFKKEQEKTGRNIFIQFGWLYLDTMEILRKFSYGYQEILSVYNTDELAQFLQVNHQKVAGVFTEIPTNPFLHTPDLPALQKICQKNNIPLVADATLGTPINIETISFCDIVVESLTKFACGNADVMAGAIIGNPQSKWYQQIKETLALNYLPLYNLDKNRLAYHIKNYRTRVEKIRNNVKPLVEYFSSQPNTEKVYWSHSQENIENYSKIEKKKNSYVGLVSVSFNKPLAEIYNKIRHYKGPSLGTEFTLVMPYMYLAYYDLIKEEYSRKELIRKGLNPEMIRISVGIEPIEMIIKNF